MKETFAIQRPDRPKPRPHKSRDIPRSRASGTLWTLAAISLVFLFCTQALLAIPYLSATTDEPVHLAAGYSYWQTRDFRMNPEHPPLAKLLAALPLLALHPRFDTANDAWQHATEDAFAFRFLYQNDADRLLFWSRAVMV